ncbi:ATP10 protein-domain-containing protein [Abortiporus biennis]|nr:ATP10 protein-domain-containing protein [Abortiporus biennis]
MHALARQRSAFLSKSLRSSLHPTNFQCRRQLTCSAPRNQNEQAASTSTSSDLKGKQKEDAVVEDVVQNKTDDVPLLNRPLGVREPPSIYRKSWRENMTDQDIRMQQRRALVREASKGYFSDLNQTRVNSGKLWMAPKVLIRADKALYFPDVSGTDLTGKKVHTTNLLPGKITALAILNTKVSEVQTEAYLKPTVQAYGDDAKFQVLRINLQENVLKSVVVSFFRNSIKSAIPEDQWDKYLISNGSMDYVREAMGLTNQRIGYIYLVDEQSRIRWAAVSDPKREEIAALKACTGVLLKRQTR